MRFLAALIALAVAGAAQGALPDMRAVVKRSCFVRVHEPGVPEREAKDFQARFGIFVVGAGAMGVFEFHVLQQDEAAVVAEVRKLPYVRSVTCGPRPLPPRPPYRP